MEVLPVGKVQVQLSWNDSAKAECLRDLKRTLEAGNVFVVGPGRRYPLRDPSMVQGDVSREACQEAFEELSRAIGFEILVQATSGCGCARGCIRPPGHCGPCTDGQLADISRTGGAVVDRETMNGIAQRVAANMSVSPGLQAVLAHDLPPALWQPTFAICVGSGEVRVLTLAFVGDPVAGDRPSCKRTQTILRLLSDDLVPQTAMGLARYVGLRAKDNAASAADHLADFEEELFGAIAPAYTSRLQDLHAEMPTAASAALAQGRECAPPVSSSTNHCGTPAGSGRACEAPIRPAVPTVVDRQARMRATLARTQSPLAAMPRGRGRSTVLPMPLPGPALAPVAVSAVTATAMTAAPAVARRVTRPEASGWSAPTFGAKLAASFTRAFSPRPEPLKPERSRQIVDRAARMRERIRAQSPSLRAMPVAA